MSEGGDRLLILLVAVTAIGGLVGWMFGLFSRTTESIAGVTDTMALGAMAFVFVVLVVVVIVRSNFHGTD